MGIIVGASVGIVYAATAESDWRAYGPVYGYSYENKAEVSNDSDLFARTHIRTTGKSAPAGYMGIQARLYKSGMLCSSSDYRYNGQDNTVGMWTTVKDDCGSGAYYSRGVSFAYNGDGYNEYNTYQSPSINH